MAGVTREYAMTGFTVREHRVEVPVDWSAPERFGSIEVFARELVDPDKVSDDQPLLLFLQGGPGGQGPPAAGRWLGRRGPREVPRYPARPARDRAVVTRRRARHQRGP